MSDPHGRWSRRAVPGIPFVFSLGVSLATISPTVFWQDSGFYLTAVHEFSVLYPHGFVLYLALCKIWTLAAAPIFGFTLSVHLFSALCAAGAASFAARAARAFLARLGLESGADLASIGAACLLAAGYSFWHAALLAKAYALYYFALAVLLLLLVSAERRRDFLLLGAILGLCWAAHPSAALFIPGILAFAWARRDRIRELGWGFTAAVAGIAVAAALAPSLFLPLIASRESIYDFGSPQTAEALFDYLRGRRYTDADRDFGFDASRVVRAASFVWEEFLGVGLGLLGVGVVSVARRRPRLLQLFAAGLLPLVGATLAFRAEGQTDLWLVSAYLPLSLLTACGLQLLAQRRIALAAGSLAAGLLWMLGANAADLNQRRYPYAEQFARFLTKNLEHGSMLFLGFDDSIATVSWLRAVKGEARDLVMLVGQRLGIPWYDQRLSREFGVRIPSWEYQLRSMPGIRMDSFELIAFANENVRRGRALYSEMEPDARFLRDDLAVVPAGMLWKIAVRSEAARSPRYWDYPADLMALSRDIRRPRGVMGQDSKPEPFENRLLLRLIEARLRLADAVLEESPRASLDDYELVRRAWPPVQDDERFLLQWGSALRLSGRLNEAEDVFGTLLKRPIRPWTGAVARYHWGEIRLAQGRREEARAAFEEALRSGALGDPWKKQIESRLRQP
jgi:hypothetical protein